MRPTTLQVLVALGAASVAGPALTEAPPDLPRLLHAWSPTDAAMIDFDCQATGQQSKINCGYTQVSILRHLDRPAMLEQLKEISAPAGQKALSELCTQVGAQTKAERDAAVLRFPTQQQGRMRSLFNACVAGDLTKVTREMREDVVAQSQTCSVLMRPRKTETFQRIDANTWIAQLSLGQSCSESVTMTAWRSAPGEPWVLKNVKTVPPTAGSRCVIGEQVTEFREDTGTKDLGCRYFARFPAVQ